MAVHRYEHRVIFGDTDALGIVYYANYFRYFELVRSEWFRDFYKSPTQMIADDNFMIVVKAHANYHCPAVYDDVLVIESWVPRDMIRGASLRFEYDILRKSDMKLLVNGYTTHTFTDAKGRLKRTPKPFTEALKTLAEDRRILVNESR